MCKKKVNNDIWERKTIKLNPGMMTPTHKAILTQNATKARMKPFDYLVHCAMYIHEHGFNLPKPECHSDNDNRQTFIKKKIQEYLANESDYRRVLLLESDLIEQISKLNIDYSDPFHATNMNAEVDELHYNLADVRAALRDHSQSGEGLLRDISNLLSNRLVWPLEAAGEDTCFTLMCKHGTITLPLKVVGNEIWMGSLPTKSVVFLNGKKIAIK